MVGVWGKWEQEVLGDEWPGEGKAAREKVTGNEVRSLIRPLEERPGVPSRPHPTFREVLSRAIWGLVGTQTSGYRGRNPGGSWTPYFRRLCRQLYAQ